jgi:hypothetical protein
MTPPERAEYDQALADLHGLVDEAGFQQLWDAGHAMDMDQAVDLALSTANRPA